jgi:hypothetical protein
MHIIMHDVYRFDKWESRRIFRFITIGMYDCFLFYWLLLQK